MHIVRRVKKAPLVGAFFVSLLWVGVAQAFCFAPEGLQVVEVRQVVDGDTLRLADGRSVRLIGLNTPELGRKGRHDEPFAEAARRRLEELVRASGGRVGLRPGEESRDRYGRLLAHGYDARGRNLEALLLADGLGYFVAVAPNTALLDCQRAAEEQARQAGLGVWTRPVPIRAQALARPGFTLLSGRVAHVEHNRGGIWLELEGDVVLNVPPPQRARFDAASLSALVGQQVEVRGWVLDRRGSASRSGRARWLLRLTHPAMLRPLR